MRTIPERPGDQTLAPPDRHIGARVSQGEQIEAPDKNKQDNDRPVDRRGDPRRQHEPGGQDCHAHSDGRDCQAVAECEQRLTTEWNRLLTGLAECKLLSPDVVPQHPLRIVRTVLDRRLPVYRSEPLPDLAPRQGG